jgi:protein TonB
MRNTLILLSLLGLPLLSLGQETEKKVVEVTTPMPSREEYSVLKADPAVRQGAYLRYGGSKLKLLTRGYYAGGQKDSIWTEYGFDSKKPVAEGRYQAGRKVGVWTFNTYAGQPALRYDFSRSQVVEGKPGAPFAENWGVVFRPVAGSPALDAAPSYAGGGQQVLSFIGQNIRYPSLALRNQVMGKVLVAFTIDASGETSNYHVVKSVGSGCDEEALRVVKLLPPSWIPAQTGGKAVAAECEMPVSFSIR